MLSASTPLSRFQKRLDGLSADQQGYISADGSLADLALRHPATTTRSAADLKRAGHSSRKKALLADYFLVYVTNKDSNCQVLTRVKNKPTIVYAKLQCKAKRWNQSRTIARDWHLLGANLQPPRPARAGICVCSNLVNCGEVVPLSKASIKAWQQIVQVAAERQIARIICPRKTCKADQHAWQGLVCRKDTAL